MIIKKSASLLLISGLLAMSFAGCNGSESSSSQGTADSAASAVAANTDADVSATADKLKSEIKFDEELGEIDGDKINSVLGVSDDKYTKAKCYISQSGSTPEEIDCFEAKDEASAGEIKSALESRLETQKNTFKDYNADQAPKLDKAVLTVNGKYVYFCVSGDSDKAAEIIG